MYSAAATACIFRIGQGEKNVKESEKDVDNRRCSYGADALHSKGSCADSEMQRDQSIILLAILIWAILHLIYFLLVLFAIFKFNVQNMDKEIDEENKWKNEIVKKIAIIQSDMQEIVKEIKKSK